MFVGFIHLIDICVAWNLHWDASYHFRSREWKSLPSYLTSDKKSVLTVISYTLAYILTEHTNPLKNTRLLILPFSPRTASSDLALWRHHNSICDVTEREVLVLWRHIRRMFLHVQIDWMKIFISE